MSDFKVGFSTVNVNPPLGIGIAGYFIPRYAKGFLDDLDLRTLALSCSGKQIVMISIPNCNNFFADRCAEEIEKALNVYGGCQRLIEKYKLDAITVRCFELINYVPTTGCLALAILNTEGIPAACEGIPKIHQPHEA